MTQPASVVNDGNHLLMFLSTQPTTFNSPTLAELTAGFDFTGYLTESGWTPGFQEQRVPDGRLLSNVDYELKGRVGVQSALSYVSNPKTPAADVARTTFVPGTTGVIVWRPLVAYTTALAAGDLVSLYSILFGEQEYVPPTGNSLGMVTQQLFLRPPGRAFMASVAA